MSKLREKSTFNINAAEILYDKSYYAPSVHCSYYSCFQLMKFTVNDFFGIDYVTLSTQISSSRKRTHQYLIDYISDELIQLSNISESQRFKRKIKDLKQFREESDYENIEVRKEKCESAIKKAEEIRNYLKQNFHV